MREPYVPREFGGRVELMTRYIQLERAGLVITEDRDLFLLRHSPLREST